MARYGYAKRTSKTTHSSRPANLAAIAAEATETGFVVAGVTFVESNRAPAGFFVGPAGGMIKVKAGKVLAYETADQSFFGNWFEGVDDRRIVGRYWFDNVGFTAEAMAAEIAARETARKPQTKAEIMSRAWQIARAAADIHGGKARSYIAESLRMAWAEAR